MNKIIEYIQLNKNSIIIIIIIIMMFSIIKYSNNHKINSNTYCNYVKPIIYINNKEINTKINNIKLISEVYNKLNLKNIDINNKITTLVYNNAQKGPTIRSAWLTKNILMGTVPYNCEDVINIINYGVNFFMSLRENDELYKFCLKSTAIIFFRFRIPDFLTRAIDDVKTQIDNLIYFLTHKQNKILIHCQGGHGRTGIFACILVAYYFFLPEIKKNLDIFKSQKLLAHEYEHEIHNLAGEVFKKSQAYVVLTTRLFRETDGEKYRKIDNVIMPETPAQNLLVQEVIKLYIHNYIINGFFNINEIENKNQKNYPYFDNEFNKLWECPKNVLANN
jgi:protein tyrosine phosphatase